MVDICVRLRSTSDSQIYGRFSLRRPMTSLAYASNDVTPVNDGATTRQYPRWGILIDKKRRKGVSKDPNTETFWADMPYIILIAKTKEINPNWGPKKLLSELKLGYTERTVKGMLTLYFYDSKVGCMFRKSVENNVHHRKCVSKDQLN